MLLRETLVRNAEEKQISKRVFWHLFRHSSATKDADLGEPMLRNVYGWSKNSDEPSTFIHLSGEAVKKTLVQKVGVQQKAEAETKAIMYPRCKCPNEPTATLCVKCKSVLRLQDAVSISTVQKKLVEQNKTIEKMQGQIDMMMQGLMEKDHQYFELKCPRLKTLAREQEKQRFKAKNELRIGE